MRVVLRICLAAILTLGGIVFADEAELAEAAFKTMDESDLGEWAYTQTTVKNGVKRVATHDPTRPEGERWTLVSVDGRPPTEKEQEKHRPSADGNKDSEDGFAATVEPGSLKLIKETPTHAIYSFHPASDDEHDRKFNEHMDATLRIAKAQDGPYVETLEMHSREPFSPAFSFKVNEFALVLAFAPVKGGRAVLPASVSTHIAGRAMMVKKIEETVEVTYSDFRHVAGDE